MHVLNEIFNHCLKSATGQSCALGISGKNESKPKFILNTEFPEKHFTIQIMNV